jgi:hypothetical protein
MVLKSVKTQDKPVETIETSDLDWDSELSVFENVDLNKPTLLEYYTKDTQALPNGGTKITYTKLEDAESPVQYLHLQVSPDQKLQHLEAVLQDKNVLFFTRRKVELSAEPGSGNIAGYHVEGMQKLIFGDTLHYEVDANL